MPICMLGIVLAGISAPERDGRPSVWDVCLHMPSREEAERVLIETCPFLWLERCLFLHAKG
jgi:hypothetical protein